MLTRVKAAHNIVLKSQVTGFIAKELLSVNLRTLLDRINRRPQAFLHAEEQCAGDGLPVMEEQRSEVAKERPPEIPIVSSRNLCVRCLEAQLHSSL